MATGINPFTGEIYPVNIPETIITDPAKALYRSSFRSVGISGASGLSAHASGGLVATTAGTSGTGSMYLPTPIDPTKPWRAAVLIEINDSQPIENIQFTNEAGDWWCGARLTSVSTNFISGDWAGGGQFLNQWGFPSGIPVGTRLWFGLSSSGTGDVNLFLIPEGVDVNGITFGSTPGYQAAWSSTIYQRRSPITTTSSGNNVWGGAPGTAQFRNALCRLSISTKSTQNRIMGVYWAQSLDGPTDGLFLPPLLLQSPINQDTTAWVLVPGKQNSASLDMVMLPHPNGSDHHANTGTGSPGAPALMKLFTQGKYLLFGILGSQSSTGYSDATASNWGSPAGLVYRKVQLDWIRQNIKRTRYCFSVGQSMGFLNTLAFCVMYPGTIRGIISVAGVTDIADSYANRGFSGTINKAYGRWYVCIQAGTGQNPATQTAYWTQISFGFGSPDESYYASPYVWRDVYTADTSYAVNDIVCVAATGTSSTTFNFINPLTNPSIFQKVPILIQHSSGDTLIPISQATAFRDAVNASGGNVTVTTMSGDHLAAGNYDGDAMMAFLNANV